MDESGRYALVVSSSRYSHPTLRPLSAPQEDAKSLEELLRNREMGAFQVRPIVDQPSWVVEMEVERFFRERRLNDLALFYFSGHGIKDEDGALYFATMDTDPDTLRSTTLSSEDVTAAMRRCRSRQQVIVLDCCYAGAFSKSMFAKGGERVGVQERFATGGSGRVVLAASDAMQIALEGGQVQGEQTLSVFTRALVEGIRSGAADRNGDGIVSLDELYDYVYEQVRKEYPEQTPTISNLEKKGDIVIALSPLGEPDTTPPLDEAKEAEDAEVAEEGEEAEGVKGVQEAEEAEESEEQVPPSQVAALHRRSASRVDHVLQTLRTHRRPWLGLGVLAVAVAAVGLWVLWPRGGDDWSMAVGPDVLRSSPSRLLTDIAGVPSDDRAVAVGKSGNRPWVWTYNGTSWSQAPQEGIDRGTGQMNAVSATDQAMIAVGRVDYSGNDENGMVWRRSADGRWTRTCGHEVCGGSGKQDIFAATAIASDRLIAVGRDSRTGDFDAAVWLSDDDGLHWERAALGNASLGGDLDQEMKGVVEIDGRIVAVGSSGPDGAVWMSDDDGSDWTLVSGRATFSGQGEQIELLAVETLESQGQQRLVVTGRETHDGESRAAAWFSDDHGRQWSTALIRNATFSRQQMVDVVRAPDGLLAVGNAAQSEAGVWHSGDGTEWVDVSSESFGGPSGMTGVAALQRGTVFAVGTAIWLSDSEE